MTTPGGRASAGSVGVDVKPQARGFWREFQAQTRADAVKAGQEIGRTIAAAVVERLNEAIAEGIARGGRNAKGAAIAAGNNIGTTIAARVTSTVSQAIGNGVSEGGKAGAAKGTTAGQEIGRAIVASVARQIRDSITEGVDRGGREAAPKGTRDGEQYGGRFGAAVRARIGAALRALPKATIDGDATPAEERIAELRVELAKLRDAKIGVDLDEGEALAKLRLLQLELNRVGRGSESVQVRVNTGAASAELAALEAELAGVGNSAGGSQGSVRGLTALLVGMGPAAIPVAAAVAGGLIGIGAAAAAGVAGAAAAVLGFAGIGGAIKALNDEQLNAGQAATAYASAQSQVAAAADQLKSAEAGLAQAEANAADGRIRAAQSLRSAEAGLVSAQRQARDAQVALNTAREEAVRSLQDLDSQVKGNALDERQATLDRTRAQIELQRVLLNPVANEVQRAQAQLTFEQAEQHLQELGVQRQRLTLEQDRATKAGVEGSRQVVTAQRQVEQANQAVADAQEHVADAIRDQTAQQRQAAFSIASAQQAIVSAQRQVAQASAGAGTAGAAAFDKVRQSMDGLSPSGERFARFLFGLKPILSELRATAQGGILPGAEEGIRRTLPLIPELNAGLADVSKTVGEILARGGSEFASAPVQRFIAFVRGEASPVLATAAEIAFNLARGVAGIAIAFQPVEREVGAGLLVLAQRFRLFGESAGTNPEVQRFIAYVLDKGPDVVHTALAVAGAVLRIAEAAAPIGSVTLTGIRLLSNVISVIPVPILTQLLAVIVPLVVAIKVWDAASGAFAKTQSVVNSVTEFASGAIGRFSGSVGAVTTKTAAAGAGVASFAAGIGGPLTIALTAATILIGMWVEQAAQQKARIESLTSSLIDLGANYQSVGDASSGMLKNLIDNDANFRSLIRNSSELGIGIDTISDAVRGNQNAVDSINRSYDDQIGKLEEVNKGIQIGVDAAQGQQDVDRVTLDIRARYGQSVQERINALKAEREAVNAATSKTKEQADALKIVHGRQLEVHGSSKVLSQAELNLYDALEKVRGGEVNAATAADTLRQAYDKLYGPAQNQEQAAERFAEKLDKVREIIHKGNVELGDNTAAARTNKDAIRDLIKQSVDQYNTDIANGVAIAEATRRHEARIGALKDEVVQGGFNEAKVGDLIKLYGQVPSVVSTELRLLGFAEADGKLTAIGERARQLAEKYGLDVKTAARLATSGVGNKLDRLAKELPLAEGGHVRGPGTDTSDSIPARLSDYEYVQPAAAVRHYGVDFMEAIRTRSLPRFAAGGLVGPELGLRVDSDLTNWPTYQLYTLAADAALKTLENLGTLANTGLYQGADPTGSVGAILGVARLFDRGAQVSSGYRAGSTSLSGNSDYHSQGLAADLVSSNGATGMVNIARGFYNLSGRLLEELHSQSPGFFVKNGQRVGAGYYGPEVAGHFDHVHIAAKRRDLLGFDDGGWLPPGISTTFNDTGRPEPVLTGPQWDMVRQASHQGGGMTLRVVVEDGEIAGLVRVEVDDAFGVLADAQVYGAS